MNRINLVSYNLFKLNNLLSNSHSTKVFTRLIPKQISSTKYLQFSRSVTNNQKTPLTSDEDQKNLIFTIPNVLTGLRIVSIPFINYFVFTGQHDIACGLFVLASITDGLDGYIARNVPNQLSHLGSILDPLADKLLIGK